MRGVRLHNTVSAFSQWFSLSRSSLARFSPNPPIRILALATVLFTLLGSGCTSVTIDQYRRQQTGTMQREDSVVVLGRRNASDYETEVDMISCVGDILGDGKDGIHVIPEAQFVDELYPWFEPRTAPMHVDALKRMVQREDIASVMENYGIRYIVWIDGKTETTSSAGSIGCSIGVGGAGCFGFGTWDKESEYEATIWDYDTHELLGKISADAEGTSYMPAVVVPIPIIARVQTSACKGMASQLKDFFKPQQKMSQN